MTGYTLDELGDWAVNYYLGLTNEHDSAYAVSQLRSIEDFISYLKRDI